MTTPGKTLHIRLAIAIVAIIVLIFAAKILFLPEKAEALLNRGEAKADAGNWAGAIADYTAVTQMPEASAETKGKARARLRELQQGPEEGTGD